MDKGELCGITCVVIYVGIILSLWAVWVFFVVTNVKDDVEHGKILESGIPQHFNDFNEHKYKFLYNNEISQVIIVGGNWENITKWMIHTYNTTCIINYHPANNTKQFDEKFETKYVKMLIAICDNPDEFNALSIQHKINTDYEYSLSNSGMTTYNILNLIFIVCIPGFVILVIICAFFVACVINIYEWMYAECKKYNELHDTQQIDIELHDTHPTT